MPESQNQEDVLRNSEKNFTNGQLRNYGAKTVFGVQSAQREREPCSCKTHTKCPSEPGRTNPEKAKCFQTLGHFRC